MLLLTGAAGRDERKYPDADRFDIHRSFDNHVSFGFGIHFCLGAALARLEGRVRARRGAAPPSRLGGRREASSADAHLDGTRLVVRPCALSQAGSGSVDGTWTSSGVGPMRSAMTVSASRSSP